MSFLRSIKKLRAIRQEIHHISLLCTSALNMHRTLVEKLRWQRGSAQRWAAGRFPPSHICKDGMKWGGSAQASSSIRLRWHTHLHDGGNRLACNVFSFPSNYQGHVWRLQTRSSKRQWLKTGFEGLADIASRMAESGLSLRKTEESAPRRGPNTNKSTKCSNRARPEKSFFRQRNVAKPDSLP